RFLLHRPFNLTSPAAFPNPVKKRVLINSTDRYVGHGYDNRDLEACFDDIMKEERRSARIAREEDEMEAKLIAEEEERERQRKSLFEVSNGDQRRRLSSSCDRAVEMLFSFFYDSSCGARDYLKLRNRGTILSLSRSLKARVDLLKMNQMHYVGKDLKSIAQENSRL
ncbi:hypothetical protein HID58_084843, partial [Brassica napus]